MGEIEAQRYLIGLEAGQVEFVEEKKAGLCGNQR